MTRLVAGFQRRYCIDRIGRRITFYVSMPQDHPAPPLLVYVQGSGCHSLFVAANNGTVRARQQGILAAAARGRAAVLAVEKPGVRFLDNPGPSGTAEPCRPAFWREHTLDRWVTAIEAAVTSVSPSVGQPIALIGHSEGAIAAAAVARRLAILSHVVLLSGSGPSQLFDLLTTQIEQGQPGGDVIDMFNRIQRNPERWRSLAWGHPYRRWSSFLATSTLEELLASSARVLIIHGMRDDVVPIASARLLYTELMRCGRDVRLVERDTGHDLTPRGKAKGKAIRRMFEQVVDWVLNDEGS